MLISVYSLDEKEFQPNGDLQIFENEWMEVEVKPPLNWGLPPPATTLQVPNSFSEVEQGVPHFLCDEVDATYSDCDQEGNYIFCYFLSTSVMIS